MLGWRPGGRKRWQNQSIECIPCATPTRVVDVWGQNNTCRKREHTRKMETKGVCFFFVKCRAEERKGKKKTALQGRHRVKVFPVFYKAKTSKSSQRGEGRILGAYSTEVRGGEEEKEVIPTRKKGGQKAPAGIE